MADFVKRNEHIASDEQKKFWPSRDSQQTEQFFLVSFFGILQRKLAVVLITVHVDNIGAIFMSENVSATKQTRHVHTRYRFVYEEVEDGRIVVRFVKTDENKADPYMKNVKSEIYDRSVSSYMMDKQQFDSREGVGE
jgi:hypothetical protein